MKKRVIIFLIILIIVFSSQGKAQVIGILAPNGENIEEILPEGYGSDIPNLSIKKPQAPNLNSKVFSDNLNNAKIAEISNTLNKNIFWVIVGAGLVFAIIIIIIILIILKKRKNLSRNIKESTTSVKIFGGKIGKEIDFLIFPGIQGVGNKLQLFKDNLKIAELPLCKEKICYTKKILKYKIPQSWIAGEYNLKVYDVKAKKWIDYFFEVK